jgi:hypothetical protein
VQYVFRRDMIGSKRVGMMLYVTFIVLAFILPANGIYSSIFTFSSLGQEFQPQFSNQMVSSTVVRSRLLCSAQCNEHIPCRTFDYDSSSGRCRLWEADLTTGSVIFSTSSSSSVGYVVLSVPLYVPIHDEPCSACQENRYQICSVNTSTCQCPPNTFWNDTICLLQLFQNATCTQIDACRADLNLICAKDSNNTFTRCSPGK